MAVTFLYGREKMEIKGLRVIPPQPEKTQEYIQKILCDLCKKTEGKEGNDRVEWKTDWHYDIEHTSITYDSGSSYPEGTAIERKTFHVCPECWKTKLQPWLESQGGKYTEKDFDY